MAKKLGTSLYVGVDVAMAENVIVMLANPRGAPVRSLTVKQNEPGMREFASALNDVLRRNTTVHDVYIGFEATGVYSSPPLRWAFVNLHFASINVHVYHINPMMVKRFKETYLNVAKTDARDARAIAEFVAAHHDVLHEHTGDQVFALRQLTRRRMRYMSAIARLRMQLYDMVFLKFSELVRTRSGDEAVCRTLHGELPMLLLTEFAGLDELASASRRKLEEVVIRATHNTIPGAKLKRVVDALEDAVKASYRLGSLASSAVTMNVASTYVLIQTYQQQRDLLDEGIARLVVGVNKEAYTVLQSVPGIGPVIAAGIIAEVPDISCFHSHGAFAHYAGLTWPEVQSGSKNQESRRLEKFCNRHLRFYICDAALHMVTNTKTYSDYFAAKCSEVKLNPVKRALVLTGRKVARLLYTLLRDKRLYSTSTMRHNVMTAKPEPPVADVALDDLVAKQRTLLTDVKEGRLAFGREQRKLRRSAH